MGDSDKRRDPNIVESCRAPIIKGIPNSLKALSRLLIFWDTRNSEARHTGSIFL